MTKFEESLKNVYDSKYMKRSLAYYTGLYTRYESLMMQPWHVSMMKLLDDHADDRMIMTLFVKAFINYKSEIHNTGALMKHIMQKYQHIIKTMGDNYNNNIESWEITSKKYAQLCNNYNCEFVDKHFRKMTMRLNLKNYIHALKLSKCDDCEKCALLSLRLSPEDSDNKELLKQIMDMPCIEKLYRNGVLVLLNSTFNIFSDELIKKIID